MGNKKAGVTWTDDNIMKWLKIPRSSSRGTRWSSPVSRNCKTAPISSHTSRRPARRRGRHCYDERTFTHNVLSNTRILFHSNYEIIDGINSASNDSSVLVMVLLQLSLPL